MSEIIAIPFACIGITVILAVAVLRLKDLWFEPSHEQVDEASRLFRKRLQSPDFATVERHFGHPLPECLLQLHSDKQELLQSDFFVASTKDTVENECWEIAYYQPLDGQSIRESWHRMGDYFAFASDGFGNDYLIDPKENDPAVLFYEHERGELTRVCDRFTEFMKWPRLGIKIESHDSA